MKTPKPTRKGRKKKVKRSLMPAPARTAIRAKPLANHKILIGLGILVLVLIAWFVCISYRSDNTSSVQSMNIDASQSVSQEAANDGSLAIYNAYDQQFSVPTNQVFERSFELRHSNVVTVQLEVKQGPPVNVFLLDGNNYTKYRSSGSLLHLSKIETLSQENTTSYSAEGQLKPGKYVFLILRAKKNVFSRWDGTIRFSLIKKDS